MHTCFSSDTITSISIKFGTQPHIAGEQV